MHLYNGQWWLEYNIMTIKGRPVKRAADHDNKHPHTDLSCALWYTVWLVTNILAILTHQIVSFTGYFTPHGCKHHRVIRSPVDNHILKSRCCERLMEMQNRCLAFVHRQITWFRLKCMDRSVLSAAIITDIVNQDQCICWQ